MKHVEYSRAALKTLSRMPRPTARRIREKIELYAADPAALGNNVTALNTADEIRLRVGDWRVIMRENSEGIAVIKVGPRGEIYRR